MQDRYRERENRGTSDPIPLSSVVCRGYREENRRLCHKSNIFTPGYRNSHSSKHRALNCDYTGHGQEDQVPLKRITIFHCRHFILNEMTDEAEVGR